MSKLAFVAIAAALPLGIATQLVADPATWDDQLDYWGVYYTNATPSNGTWYWRLVYGEARAPYELGGGTVNIFYKCLNASGTQIGGQQCWAAYPTGNPTTFVSVVTKTPPDWGDFPMAGGNWCPAWPDGGPHGPYGAYIDGISDQVWGMGLPCNNHWSYYLTWRYVQADSTKPSIRMDPFSIYAPAEQYSDPSDEIIHLSNTAPGTTLNYTLSDNAAWMTVTPTSGSVTTGSDDLTVSFDGATKDPGDYWGTITVSDPNAIISSIQYAVLMRIADPTMPHIQLSPTEITRNADEGTSPSNSTFTVSNPAVGTLNYNVTDDVDWLSVSPVSGSSTGEADPITITYHTSDLPYGTYTGHVIVASTYASNSPQLVTVQVNLAKVFKNADFDKDGDVDVADFATFGLCFNGANQPFGESCPVTRDIDGDLDFDVADFAAFSRCFAGANQTPPPEPTCY